MFDRTVWFVNESFQYWQLNNTTNIHIALNSINFKLLSRLLNSLIINLIVISRHEYFNSC